MNNKIFVLTALLACILLLQTGFSTGQLETGTTLSINGVVEQSPTPTPIPTRTPTPPPSEQYSYIATVSGANYIVADGTTRETDYQSKNATQIVNDAIANLTQGGSILFEPGTYNLNGSIIGTSEDNITLVFENGATLFVASGMNVPAIFLNAANNWLISGLTIDGNAANQAVMSAHGIEIDNSKNSSVDGATIYNCRQFGFVAIGSGSVNDGISNSKLTSCGWNGITLGGGYGELSLYAINNEVSNSSDVGITTYGIGSIIRNNYIYNINGTTGYINSRWGIGIEAGGNDLITQNNIQNCADGIFDNGLNNITISNNIVIGEASNSWYGIELHNNGAGTKYSSVLNNTVIGAKIHGIYLVGATFNEIKENNVSLSNQSGIYLDEISNNNTISLNYVFDNSLDSGWASGIDIFGSSNYISQNQGFDDRSRPATTQAYGICIESGACNNVLTENVVYNNLHFGICMNPGAYENVLIRNNVTNNLAGGIYDPNVPENAMINNTGYNPVGYIANPISGNTAYFVDSGSNSTLINGRMYTNTGATKELIISGGTLSVVVQNGVTLFTGGNCTLTLQPNDTFIITFSAAPTIRATGK